MTKGQGHNSRSKVTDVEVSAFSECFLFPLFLQSPIHNSKYKIIIQCMIPGPNEEVIYHAIVMMHQKTFSKQWIYLFHVLLFLFLTPGTLLIFTTISNILLMLKFWRCFVQQYLTEEALKEHSQVFFFLILSNRQIS